MNRSGQITNIPNLYTGTMTDEKGNMTESALSFFNQLVVCLQIILSTEGIKIPQLSTQQINLLTKNNSIGNIVYDNVTHELKAAFPGASVGAPPVWKVIQVV